MLRRFCGRTPVVRHPCPAPAFSSSSTPAPRVHWWGVQSPASFAKLSLRVCATIGVSLTAGDFVCQLLEARPLHSSQVGTPSPVLLKLSDRVWHRLGQWDFERSKKMWIIGTFISGPGSHCWQMLIERRVPGTSIRSIVAKTALNACFALTVSLPLMFTASTLLEPPRGGRHNTLEDAADKLRKDLWPTFVAGTLFWPFMNFIVFKWVRVQNRAVVNSVIAVVWNVYLSSKVNNGVLVPAATTVPIGTVEVVLEEEEEEDGREMP